MEALEGQPSLENRGFVSQTLAQTLLAESKQQTLQLPYELKDETG
jgi:hypothetical protein